MILSSKFKTYSTPKNYNSTIGVAISILENLNWLADVFIVEMGAYKRGEIKEICDLVPPDIAIITAVSEQHLALFGDIENTLMAKYEIVENSKKDATIVLNGDNDLVLRVAGKSSKNKILYSTTKELDLWASDIKSKGDYVEFNVHHKGENKRFEVKVLGEHNVSNVLAATASALTLGMTLDEIAEVLKKGSKRKKIGRLAIRKSRFGYQVIDDSYNSNSQGFSAALDILSRTKGGKKVLVTIGIIEAGDRLGEVYKALARQIVDVCDVLLTTDKRLVSAVKDEKANFEIILDTNLKRQLSFLTRELGREDVVLFEGPNIRLLNEILK
ncbi:UDP-N-acetylmuramoyl-tripeptide--D-alanyl-D-alanine ligase [Patescibacteria group bacterium]|nr:UDP-N-acetylmuramoyl-tripeptide--D-alanyl-D-alanine ligase [Patescibacteria group bacterium]